MRPRVTHSIGLLAALLVACAPSARSPAAPAQFGSSFEDDIDAKPWEEIEPQLPAYPQDQALIEFYVSPTTSNHFFVDTASINVGTDDVVRYTLVVKTPSGAKNVSFEGVHCKNAQVRLYAFGRNDNTWAKARNSSWAEIHSNSLNRHHSALATEYFCIGNAPVSSVPEVLDALKRGGHPLLRPQPIR